MNLAVFDDNPTLFYPVSLTRSVGDIRCGILKLRQRLQAVLFGEDEFIIMAGNLLDIYKERHPGWMLNTATGDTLFVNSRLKVQLDIIHKIKSLESGQGIKTASGVLLALRYQATGESVTYSCIQDWAGYAELKTVPEAQYENMADIISDNSRLIASDFEQYFHDENNFMETEPGITLLNPYQVWIGEGVSLQPGVVIDATHGPVVVDEGAEIMSHSVIEGPAYIGKGSKIKVGARIYGGTSIGPVCKVGGELEGTIIQAYTNKQHDGFLGHAYLGEWINLGAGTCNSDLKNNYKPVTFYSYEKKTKIQSGSQFLGCIVGDHVKTGINCSLNTGVVLGAGCNIWGGSLIADFIPSFSWGEAGNLTPYIFPSFCEAAETVKQRRGLHFSDCETEMYKSIWKTEHQES